MQQKIAFIINPKSGTSRNVAIADLAQATFAHSGCQVEVFYTEHAGHGQQLATQCVAQDFETVVAVGGDGTVNEVARALINTNVALGIVPKGSGNGLARACGIPLDIQQALNVIKRGYRKLIDTGSINNEIFLSNAGVGFDAAVIKRCANENKRGLFMYLRNSVRSFASYKGRKYKIIVDDKEFTERALMISVANGNEFGYGFKIAPTASHVDGKLDVMLIKPLNIFTAGNVSFKAWRGNLHKYSKVKHLLGRNISISCSDMDCHQIDGDYRVNQGKVDIFMQHKSLQVIVP